MSEIQDELYDLMVKWYDMWPGWDHVCEKLGISEKRARQAMKQLQKEGKVRSDPMFSESMRLMGKGWFVTGIY